MADEDVSARVLIRNILHTETQRSPVTRSVSQQLLRVRRSSRARTPTDTPHVALRHKLRQKLHESAVQSPLPPSKRAKLQDRMLKTLAVLPSPALYDDDVTARGLLRGIIQSETDASLLLSGQTTGSQVAQQNTEESIHSNRRSDGVSGLELPDLTTEPLTRVIRGMSRRRLPPTFNVSVFENQLEQPSGEEEMTENPDGSTEQDLSASSKSFLSLTLKTPFINLPSERAGLKRKAAGRRNQPSVDAFDEAVHKRLERPHNPDYSVVQDGKTLQDSAWQKFTLGLSNVSVPDLTKDVIMSNTALYAHPQASESMSKRRDCDGVGKERPDIFCDQQNVSESVSSKPQPHPSEHQQPVSPSQDYEDWIRSSQGNESLSPEEVPFAPTQDMVARTPEEEEEGVSVIPEDHVNQKEGQSYQEVEQSHLPQRIGWREYHSEGGAIRQGVTAGSRGTKSFGMGWDPAEKLGSSEALQSVEAPHRRPASSSTVHTAKPSSSEMQQDEEGVNLDLVHVTPTVAVPSEEEEEQQQEEVEEEEQQQEEVEEEEQQQEEVEEEEEEQQQEEVEEEEEEQQQEDIEEEEEEQQQEEEEEDAQSEELSMQTPVFIRQRKRVSTPGALATPTIPKALNAGPAPKTVRPRPKRQPRSTSSGVLPKSYVMSVFKHFAKTKVASDVYPVLNDILQKYFDRLADDLEAYAAHANRKTIEVEDVELLMRRQGFVTDSTPVNVLIEKFLPLEYRKLLIPIAISGNKVVPDQRR